MDHSRANQTYFEEQRQVLLDEIALSFEHVLASINKLNRSLESVITVGNEFSSVEALWSQFENVMAKDDETTTGSGGSGNGRSATMGEQQQQQHKEEEEDQGLKEEERDA